MATSAEDLSPEMAHVGSADVVVDRVHQIFAETTLAQPCFHHGCRRVLASSNVFTFHYACRAADVCAVVQALAPMHDHGVRTRRFSEAGVPDEGFGRWVIDATAKSSFGARSVCPRQ